MNLEDFVFRDANTAFVNLLGYSVEEIVGRTPIGLNLFKRREDALNLANMLEEGIDISNVYIDITTKPGNICTVLFSASGINIGGKKCVLFTAVDRTAHARAENALRESERTLHSLSRKLISMQEDERAKISRQLHDDLGQRLTALALELELLMTGSGSNKSEIEKILKYTTDTISQLRKICSTLRPQTIDDIGIHSALNILIGDFAARTEITVFRQFDNDDNCEVCSKAHMQIYRIVQEALNNIARHSSANNVTIGLECSMEGGCILKIIDDGKGFVTEVQRGGFGILGMKERAALCGGELQINSEIGKGTELRLIIPRESMEPGGGGI